MSNKTALSKFFTKIKHGESLTGRAIGKTILPVSTIAVNIAKRGIDYSSLGVEGWAKLVGETKKSMHLNEAEGKAYNSWAAAVKDGIKEIPIQQRKYINGVISRGLFGVATGLITAYGLANGQVKYGGTWDDSRKRKVIGSDGEQLKPGEWEFFGKKMPDAANKFLNHLPEFLNMSLVANMYQIHKADKDAGKESSDQFKTAMAEVEARLPFMTLLAFAQGKPLETIIDRFTRVPLATEISNATDENAKNREKKTLSERLKANIGLGELNPLKQPSGGKQLRETRETKEKKEKRE
jgi:hypothetical protein